jgi:hypothetical protein
MTPRQPSGPNDRDPYGSRPYENLPSVTPRVWGPRKAHGDPFGYDGQGGYGDFREGAERAAGEPRQSRGGHRGRGPKAVRQDSSIADEVYFRLTEDGYVDGSEILVNVENGVVTLTGEVPERRMKHRAEDLVAEIRGVRELHNRIRVDPVQRSFTSSLGGLRAGESQKGSGFASESPGHGVPGPGTRSDGSQNRPGTDRPGDLPR